MNMGLGYLVGLSDPIVGCGVKVSTTDFDSVGIGSNPVTPATNKAISATFF